MKDDVSFWVISAKRDLDECLNPFIKYVEHVCFNAQQAAEKILKARLVHNSSPSWGMMSSLDICRRCGSKINHVSCQFVPKICIRKG